MYDDNHAWCSVYVITFYFLYSRLFSVIVCRVSSVYHMYRMMFLHKQIAHSYILYGWY